MQPILYVALLVGAVAAAAFVAASLLGLTSIPLFDVGGGNPHPHSLWNLLQDVGGGNPHPR